MYLHGSHARGEQGSLSDLDLAALLDDRTAGVLQVELELLGALQRASGREDIDLVILNRAGPIIKDRVVRYGRLIWARHEQDRVYFEERAIKEALDFGYFSRQYDQALFQQLREGERLG
jgi:predicted nucleotidyltransferase